jgi:GNAT superfamily N-acetyltransferase
VRILTAREQYEMQAPWRLTFVDHDVRPEFAGEPGITAYLNGSLAGRISWWHPAWSPLLTASLGDAAPRPYELKQVEVRPDLRGRGIASALLRQALAVEPRICFSPRMTPDGARWAASLGYAPSEYIHVPARVSWAIWEDS